MSFRESGDVSLHVTVGNATSAVHFYCQWKNSPLMGSGLFRVRDLIVRVLSALASCYFSDDSLVLLIISYYWRGSPNGNWF